MKKLLPVFVLFFLCSDCSKNADETKAINKHLENKMLSPRAGSEAIVEFPFDTTFVARDAVAYLDHYINDVNPKKHQQDHLQIGDTHNVSKPTYAAINAVTENGDSVKRVIVMFPPLENIGRGWAFADWSLSNDNQYRRGRVGFTIGSYAEFVTMSRTIEINN